MFENDTVCCWMMLRLVTYIHITGNVCTADRSFAEKVILLLTLFEFMLELSNRCSARKGQRDHRTCFERRGIRGQDFVQSNLL